MKMLAIDDSLHDELKIFCAKKGKKMYVEAEEAIKNHIKKEEVKTPSLKKKKTVKK